ncbi:MAG: single-stranded-DNA-specific exonuclease RecJ [Planctomycetota bacterium]|nr:MAG: single-stranded-DNA-specific exonuclease RecJ [Planctomycetota bacterium]
MKKRWRFYPKNPEARKALTEALHVSPVLAQLLINRGLTDPDSAAGFLKPNIDNLHDPFLFSHMERAAVRVKDAILKHEKILVYGDYDVDGITATALLIHFFRLVGAEAAHYIPSRIKEGYSLHRGAIEELGEKNIDLIISVDCGITNAAEVDFANSLGIDTIVTDHHEPGDTLPNALAILDAKLPGSTYPYRSLAGVGVAFKLAWAIAQTFSSEKKLSQEFYQFIMQAMGLAALGTIADVVPLTGENRIIAHHGLKALRESRNPGVRALLESAGLGNSPITASDVGYRLGPRINAAGRMGKAHLAIELLITNDTRRAAELAKMLETENRRRQEVEKAILASARQKLEERGGVGDHSTIVLADEGWHPGVIGIVASKLSEEYHRPTILIAIEDGVGKGSARSIPQVILHEALANCSEHLVTFGGHALAAGLEVNATELPAFTEALEREVAKMILKKGAEPELLLDHENPLSSLSRSLISDLEVLGPHGEGNSPPLFCVNDVEVVGRPRRVGRSGNHLAFTVRQGDVAFKAIAFGQGDTVDAVDRSRKSISLAFRPIVNYWQGQESIELDVKDIRCEIQ